MLQGCAEGKRNPQIGKELYISEDAIKTRLANLYNELGVRRRWEAVMKALTSEGEYITIPPLKNSESRVP